MKRHVHQMGLRKEWLAEERAQLDKVEECMREMKALAAPFIAVGDRLVIGIVESLEAQEKVLVADRLKGIAEPDASGQPLEWLRASVQELWDEKIEFGHRRPKVGLAHRRSTEGAGTGAEPAPSTEAGWCEARCRCRGWWGWWGQPGLGLRLVV